MCWQLGLHLAKEKGSANQLVCSPLSVVFLEESLEAVRCKGEQAALSVVQASFNFFLREEWNTDLYLPG